MVVKFFMSSFKTRLVHPRQRNYSMTVVPRQGFYAISTRSHNFPLRCVRCPTWQLVLRYAFFIPSRAFNKTIGESPKRNASGIFLSLRSSRPGNNYWKLSTRKVQKSANLSVSRRSRVLLLSINVTLRINPTNKLFRFVE